MSQDTSARDARVTFERDNGYTICGVNGCILADRHAGDCIFNLTVGRGQRRSASHASLLICGGGWIGQGDGHLGTGAKDKGGPSATKRQKLNKQDRAVAEEDPPRRGGSGSGNGCGPAKPPPPSSAAVTTGKGVAWVRKPCGVVPKGSDGMPKVWDYAAGVWRLASATPTSAALAAAAAATAATTSPKPPPPNRKVVSPTKPSPRMRKDATAPAARSSGKLQGSATAASTAKAAARAAAVAAEDEDEDGSGGDDDDDVEDPTDDDAPPPPPSEKKAKASAPRPIASSKRTPASSAAPKSAAGVKRGKARQPAKGVEKGGGVIEGEAEEEEEDDDEDDDDGDGDASSDDEADVRAEAAEALLGGAWLMDGTHSRDSELRAGVAVLLRLHEATLHQPSHYHELIQVLHLRRADQISNDDAQARATKAVDPPPLQHLAAELVNVHCPISRDAPIVLAAMRLHGATPLSEGVIAAWRAAVMAPLASSAAPPAAAATTVTRTQAWRSLRRRAAPRTFPSWRDGPRGRSACVGGRHARRWHAPRAAAAVSAGAASSFPWITRRVSLRHRLGRRRPRGRTPTQPAAHLGRGARRLGRRCRAGAPLSMASTHLHPRGVPGGATLRTTSPSHSRPHSSTCMC